MTEMEKAVVLTTSAIPIQNGASAPSPIPTMAIQWRAAFGFVIWISGPRQYRFSPFAAVAIMFASGVQADRNAL